MIGTAHFLSNAGPVALQLAAGDLHLIAGPNGVGKSALLASLYRSLPQGLGVYLPGHRQISFNHGWDNFGQDLAQFQTNLYANFGAFDRYRSHFGEEQFKGLLRSLLHAEGAYNRAFRQAVAGNDQAAAEQARLLLSPLDTVNSIFDSAQLQIEFVMSDIGLSARRKGNEYGIEALSDGERAALFISSAFVTQPLSSVMLIDEPEKHLHPSISGPLMQASLRARPDIATVVSSHDVSLIEGLSTSSILHIRDSQVLNQQNDSRQYEVDIIRNKIPENIKSNILGARQPILFVEGTDASRDVALYGHVYGSIKVYPKGSSTQVIEAVRGARNMRELHWIKVAGIVDGDGRSVNERRSLQSAGVCCLPCPTIENLFFLPGVRACFVEADLMRTGGLSFEQRERALSDYLFPAVHDAQSEIISRRTCWLLDRELSSRAMGVKELRNSVVPDIVVSVEDIRANLVRDVGDVLRSRSVDTVLLSLPIKNTDIPEGCSRALGASSFKDYCDVVLRQMEIGSCQGTQARDAIRAVLPAVQTG